MIIVQVTGGLGNQLFQYATARALALRTNALLMLDGRAYQHDHFRQYCLDHFCIDALTHADAAAQGVVLPPPRKRAAAFLIWRCWQGRSLPYVRECGTAFNSCLLQQRAPAYLHGYWQSERYFLDVREIIRRELTVKTAPGGENERLLHEISERPSVSVHVRRGDYVTNPKASQVHGTCSPDYYQRAASALRARVGDDLKFYVFSDDPAWARQHLCFTEPTHYVDHNDDAHNYEDLRLMSACRHHIIANSSFSWWGAWLAAQPQKVVAAPQTWFRDPSKSDHDLVPESWLRV